MITRAVRIQLMVFLLITVVGVAFVGAKYAQVDKLIVDTDYTVSASFAESGGIFSGAEVTYRGQPVGRVGELKLLSDGVESTWTSTRRPRSRTTCSPWSPTGPRSASSTSTCNRAATADRTCRTTPRSA